MDKKAFRVYNTDTIPGNWLGCSGNRIRRISAAQQRKRLSPPYKGEEEVAFVATAPCPFGRPYGMELVLRAKTMDGPDLNEVLASHLSSFSNSRRSNPFRADFLLQDQALAANVRHPSLTVLSLHRCGPDRAHILAGTGSGGRILIENYSFKARIGDFYEFEDIRSHHIGTRYLLDLDRVFPRDDSHNGEIIQVRFNGDVITSQVEALLRQRGYRMAVVEDAVAEAVSEHLRNFMKDSPIWALPTQTLCKLDAFGRNLFEPFNDDIIPQGAIVMAEKL